MIDNNDVLLFIADGKYKKMKRLEKDVLKYKENIE